MVKEPYDLTSGSEPDFDDDFAPAPKKRGSDFFSIRDFQAKEGGSPIRIPPRARRRHSKQQRKSTIEKKPINDYSLKCSTNPINQASIQNYKLLKTIGKGLYSKVKLAASKTHANNFYAIKIIKRHDVEKVSLALFKQIMLNEVTLL